MSTMMDKNRSAGYGFAPLAFCILMGVFCLYNAISGFYRGEILNAGGGSRFGPPISFYGPRAFVAAAGYLSLFSGFSILSWGAFVGRKDEVQNLRRVDELAVEQNELVREIASFSREFGRAEEDTDATERSDSVRGTRNLASELGGLEKHLDTMFAKIKRFDRFSQLEQDTRRAESQSSSSASLRWITYPSLAIGVVIIGFALYAPMRMIRQLVRVVGIPYCS
jgi:hypothetical protein